jgi:hypothetical protein
VANDSRAAPVAIRITRPYASEEEFLEHELDMVTRTSVTLLGAQARPQGAVLRFELVLSTGQVLFRGEGRVVGFKPDAHQGLGGLTLRFTRLDSRSKGLVDRAAALRERRKPNSDAAPPSLEPPSAVIPEPSARAATVAERELEATHAEAPKSKRPGPPPLPAAARAVAAPTRAEPRSAPALPAPVPSTRDDLLGKLRDRAKTLDSAAVQRILEQRRRRA